MLDQAAVAAAVPFRPQFVVIWDGIDCNGGELHAWSDFRPLWRRVSRPALDSLLNHLYDKFCTFGYIGLQHPDGFIENDQGKLILDHCVHHSVDDWTDQGLALASTFWLAESAGVLMTELNQRLLAVDTIEPFFRAKLEKYFSIAGGEPPQEGGILSLCRQIQAARARIPAGYVRSFSINGQTWEREERYLDHRNGGNAVYPCVSDSIREHLGCDLPEAATARQRFETLVDVVTAQGVNPFEIIVAIVNGAVHDRVLDADYAVATVPQGECLDTPWVIQDRDVCSYAVVRPGFDATAEGVEFQRDQIVRAIERRMRFNTSCRSKNYHPEREVRRKAQPFQFPDIAQGESSHHVGHIKTGIKSSARTHFEIRIPSLVAYGEFRGFGDFRVNRADDSPARHYSFEELTHLLPYGQWCKTVFDYAIGKNQLMDRKYCKSP